MKKVDLSVRLYDGDIAIPNFIQDLRDWIVKQGYTVVDDNRYGLEIPRDENYREMTFTLHGGEVDTREIK